MTNLIIIDNFAKIFCDELIGFNMLLQNQTILRANLFHRKFSWLWSR